MRTLFHILLLSFLIFLTSLRVAAQCPSNPLGADIIYSSTFADGVGFSNAISRDGSTIIIGAVDGKVGSIRPGSSIAYSYDSLSDSWVQKGQSLAGDIDQERFGASVSVSSDGNIVAIGATQTSGSPSDVGGFVRVFQFDSGSSTWSLMGQQLNGFATGDAFGVALDLSDDGQIIIIGGSANDMGGLNAGVAGVYEFNSGSSLWEVKGNLIIGNTSTTKGTGTSVDISGDGSIIAVASNRNTRVFEIMGSTWTQLGTDFLDDDSDSFSSTAKLNMDGKKIAIGDENVSGFNGQIKLFEYNMTTTSWEAHGNILSGNIQNRPFGRSIGLSSDGNIVATGTYFDNSQKGSVLAFKYEAMSDTWTEFINPISGISNNERFGVALDMSGDGLRIISGAPKHNFFTGESRVFEIDTSNCGSCTFLTDTTFADIIIPCNSKLESPKILDTCIDSMLCGIPLDSGFYFVQDTFMTQWKFTTSDGTMDTVLQNIIVNGVALCDTASTGIGSLRNALDCAEEGDTIDVLASIMNDTLLLDGSGLTVDTDVILSVDPGDNVTIDASAVLSAFTIEPGNTLTLDGVNLIVGSSSDGGAAINNGTLNILNSIILPHPLIPGGSQFSGNGEINIDPLTVIHP